MGVSPVRSLLQRLGAHNGIGASPMHPPRQRLGARSSTAVSPCPRDRLKHRPLAVGCEWAGMIAKGFAGSTTPGRARCTPGVVFAYERESPLTGRTDKRADA